MEVLLGPSQLVGHCQRLSDNPGGQQMKAGSTHLWESKSLTQTKGPMALALLLHSLAYDDSLPGRTREIWVVQCPQPACLGV